MLSTVSEVLATAQIGWLTSPNKRFRTSNDSRFQHIWALLFVTLNRQIHIPVFSDSTKPKHCIKQISAEMLTVCHLAQNINRNTENHDHKRGITSTKLALKERSPTVASVASTTSSHTLLWACIFAKKNSALLGGVADTSN